MWFLSRQSNFRKPGNRREEKSDGCGQYGYIPASRNRFGQSERKNNGELVTYSRKAHQEKKKEEREGGKGEMGKEKEKGVVHRKQGKTYKVTSLGETDSSFCLKVIGSPDSSFVTKHVSSPYLPSVVE